jgi:hypothetical protein
MEAVMQKIAKQIIANATESSKKPQEKKTINYYAG